MTDRLTKGLVGKPWLVTKAWTNEDGTVNVEGWVSTNELDLEKDIMEPETFADRPIEQYFERGAPVSSEHDTSALPVGYMLKAALVRDGNIFQSLDNPRHPTADFKYFDPSETRTGWYGLVTIDDGKTAVAVAKGKLSSFSWIGMPKSWTPRPGGGRHFNNKGGIDPLLEATITAYPVNPNAIMRVAKAYGYAVEEPRPRLWLTPEGVERILQRNK